MTRRDLFCLLTSSLSYSFVSTTKLMASDDRASGVSLIRLIANASSFDGRRLRLAGYLDYNGVDRAVGLYLSEIDGRNFIVSNSVDLRIEEAKIKGLIGHYVILVGTYHAAPETGVAYNGHLDHISDLEAWNFGDKH